MSQTMLAARLHGPRDIRLEALAIPPAPRAGEALVRIRTVGICGSDLHTFVHGRIGDTLLKSPVIPGHEFCGVVESVAAGALDGEGEPLAPGALVAIDPAQPCGHCSACEHGHPNLCHNIRFCGLWPDDGALVEKMLVPASTCFQLPANTDPAIGPLLETLGVAIHAVDLSRIRVGSAVAVIGAGPVGVCIAQLARLAGADTVYITDPLPWRMDLAQRLGATPLPQTKIEVDVAIEAAWAGPALQQAGDLLRPGGTLVAAGIPDDDRFELRHSTVRRKGLTILCVRRMKHTYPRAIRLWQSNRVQLAPLISHRFPLKETAQALRLNAAYEKGVMKVIVEI